MRWIFAMLVVAAFVGHFARDARTEDPQPAHPGSPAQTATELAASAVESVYLAVGEGQGGDATARSWLQRLDLAESECDSTRDREALLVAAVSVTQAAQLWDLYYTYLLRLLYVARSPAALENAYSALIVVTSSRPSARTLLGRQRTKGGRAEAVLDALEAVAARDPRSLVAAQAMCGAADVLLAIEDEESAKVLLRRLVLEFTESDVGRGAAATLWALENLRAGKPPPTSVWVALGGEAVSTGEAVARPVVLYCWATGCPACHGVLGDLRRAQEEAKQSVAFVGLNFDDDESTMRASLTDWTGPLGPQVQMYVQAEKSRWVIDTFPRIVLVGADGSIVSGNASVADVREHFARKAGK